MYAIRVTIRVAIETKNVPIPAYAFSRSTVSKETSNAILYLHAATLVQNISQPMDESAQTHGGFRYARADVKFFPCKFMLSYSMSV